MQNSVSRTKPMNDMALDFSEADIQKLLDNLDAF